MNVYMYLYMHITGLKGDTGNAGPQGPQGIQGTMLLCFVYDCTQKWRKLWRRLFFSTDELHTWMLQSLDWYSYMNVYMYLYMHIAGLKGDTGDAGPQGIQGIQGTMLLCFVYDCTRKWCKLWRRVVPLFVYLQGRGCQFRIHKYARDIFVLLNLLVEYIYWSLSLSLYIYIYTCVCVLHMLVHEWFT